MEKNIKGTDWSHAKVLPDINNRFIVFDTETSGLNHKVNHILEIAAIEMEKGKITGQQFHIYIKPRQKIPDEVIKLNHIDQNLYSTYYEEYYLEEKQQMQKFLNFIGNDSYLFGHNVPFDFYFLNSELSFLNLPTIPIHRFRCTLRIVKDIIGKKCPGKKMSFKLENCTKIFKIKNNEEMFHNALFDSFTTAKLIVKIYEFVNGKRKEESHIEGSEGDVGVNILNEGGDKGGEQKYLKENEIGEEEINIMKNKMKLLMIKKEGEI